jgi:hypothetical protein
MKITKWIFLACLACLPLASHAQVNDAVVRSNSAGAEGGSHHRRQVRDQALDHHPHRQFRRPDCGRDAAKEIQDRTGMKLSIEA